MTQPHPYRTTVVEQTRTVVRSPDLARVTILAKNTQVDIAIPVDVPVALVIPSVVDMIAQHNRGNDFDDTGERFEASEWVLARIGQPPLTNSLSLGEHGVRDGELLMLESADSVAPRPLFDDIMYNVATTATTGLRAWSPQVARVTGSVVAGAAMVAGCVSVLAQPTSVAPNWLPGLVALVVTGLLVVAAAVLRRVYHDDSTALVLGGCALPCALTAGLVIVPVHHGHYQWANLLLGAVMLAAIAPAAWRATGVGAALFVGATTVALFAVAAAAVGLAAGPPVRAVGAGAVALGLGALSLAPRLSMLLANLPLPPVPTPGTPIDPTEDHPDDHRAMPTVAELAAKSQYARELLTGLVAGATVVTVAGAVAATDPAAGRLYWPGVALALVCAAVLMLRGRTYAGAIQAVVPIAGGSAIALSALPIAASTRGQPLVVFAVAVVILVAALVLGMVVPHRTASPPLRRAVELLEYGLVAAVIPLAFWVANLYALIRSL